MGGTGSGGEDSLARRSRPNELPRSRLQGQSSEQDTAADELETIFADIIGSAQRACPTFSVPADVFVPYLRDRLPADVPRPLALRQMHTSELYLACACACGDVRASLRSTIAA